MISVLDISLVKCYGTVKTKDESFLFQKPIASSIRLEEVNGSDPFATSNSKRRFAFYLERISTCS